MPVAKKAFFFLFTILLTLCISSSGFASDEYFRFKDGRKRQIIPFKLVKNLLIIPMTINGQGPFNFVLDTGVGLCIITDPTLAQTLKPTYVRNIKITGFGEGEDYTATIASGLNFETESIIAQNMTAAILQKDAFNLSSVTGMKIHGLIGYEFFSSFIVKIHFPNKQLTIYRPNTGYLLRKGTKVPISIEERKPYVVSEIESQAGEKIAAKLIIDTGAGHPVSLETQNGIPFVVPPKNIPANLGIGLSGPINGYLSRIKLMKLGKHELKNVITAYPNFKEVAAKISSISRNGNLGNGILKRFIVVFDYSRNAVYLKPNLYIKEPFEHDMSGMELTSGGPNYDKVFVLRIEPNSPADEAGLKKDDEILSINFKKIELLTIEEIDTLMRSKDDRSILVEVRPHNEKQTYMVVLTLKRRI